MHACRPHHAHIHLISCFACRRTSAVSSSKAASQQARGLVDEMQQRLSKEIQEREAEAALYSARLYESEKQMSDWWVSEPLYGVALSIGIQVTK